MLQVSAETATTLRIQDQTKTVDSTVGWQAAGPPPAAAVWKRSPISSPCSGMTNISQFLGGLAPSHLPVLAHSRTMPNIKAPQSKHKTVLKGLRLPWLRLTGLATRLSAAGTQPCLGPWASRVQLSLATLSSVPDGVFLSLETPFILSCLKWPSSSFCLGFSIQIPGLLSSPLSRPLGQ